MKSDIRGYYPYGERIRKLRIRKRMMSILTALVLGVGGYAFVKGVSAKDVKDEIKPIETSNPENEEEELFVEVIETPTIAPTPTVVPTATPEPVQVIYNDGYNRGDSIISTADVNLRLNTDRSSYKMGVLPKGCVVDRLLSDGEWDLVRYNNQIAYVHSDYTRENDVDYNHDYYRIEDYNDIIRTTSKVYFRLGPSKSEKDLFLLDKGEELVVIGKSISLDDSNDVWYLARARGQIGFVSAPYVKSLRSTLVSSGVDIDNIKIQKMGYLKNGVNVFDNNGKSVASLDSYQLVEVLQTDGNNSLIQCDGVVGYIPSKSITAIKGNFIAVDISSQRIYYYVDSDVAFQGKCTTGKNSNPTEIGMFKPYGKSSSHEFHDNLTARILWMPFNGGQGLHDAPWEKNSKFGDYSYTKTHGSAGCVRLPDDVAYFIYDNVSQNTPVLVKK